MNVNIPLYDRSAAKWTIDLSQSAGIAFMQCLFLSLQLESTFASNFFFWTCVPVILFVSAPHALVAQSALQFDVWALPRVC